MSMRRDHVASTLLRYHSNGVCLLGAADDGQAKMADKLVDIGEPMIITE